VARGGERSTTGWGLPSPPVGEGAGGGSRGCEECWGLKLGLCCSAFYSLSPYFLSRGSERINASGLKGVNRPAEQTQPIPANFRPDSGTSGLFPRTSGKMHFGVFSRSFREFFPLSICCVILD
jgi:hypothetical protein